MLPVLRNFFCFQTIILCQFNFLQLYKFEKPAFVTVQFFSFLNQVRQTVLHQQEMKVRFWTDNSDPELLLTETKLRIRDRL